MVFLWLFGTLGFNIYLAALFTSVMEIPSFMGGYNIKSFVNNMEVRGVSMELYFSMSGMVVFFHHLVCHVLACVYLKYIKTFPSFSLQNFLILSIKRT
jgi:hypothetical protein